MKSVNYTGARSHLPPGPGGVPAEDRILHRLSRSDGLTRRQLSEDLNLPTATVISVVTKLVAIGTLVERSSPQRRTTAGRHPRLLTLGDRRPIIGAIGWVDGKLHATLASYGGHVLAHEVLPITPGVVNVDVLSPALAFLRQAHPGDDADTRPTWLTGVVVGVPAPFHAGTGLAPGRSGADPGEDSERPQFAPWLRADPGRHLSERLAVPVLIENDANLAALGEATAGAARDHDDIVYLTVGEATVGAGLVLSGSLYRGASGFAGEIAHIHVDDAGPLCACGGRGCLASLLGRGLLDSVQAAYQNPLGFHDVLRMAVAGEPGPARLLKDSGRIVGRRVADICTFLNPSAVVVGGTLGPATEIVAAGVREQIDLFAAPMATRSMVTVVGELGARAQLMGAIALARTELPLS